MDLQMNGKTALVTGGSAGIGKAIAFALAREGVDVAICARRKEPLEAAASQIARERNRKIVPIATDLTKPADAEAFVKEAHCALGRIDILVNNAGSAPGGVLDFLTEEDWAQSLQLKFMGYVRCSCRGGFCTPARARRDFLARWSPQLLRHLPVPPVFAAAVAVLETTTTYRARCLPCASRCTCCWSSSSALSPRAASRLPQC